VYLCLALEGEEGHHHLCQFGTLLEVEHAQSYEFPEILIDILIICELLDKILAIFARFHSLLAFSKSDLPSHHNSTQAALVLALAACPPPLRPILEYVVWDTKVLISI
jgi:hypothetical protein